MHDWRINFYATTLLISTILCLVVFALLWKRRKIAGALELSLLMASVALWAATTAGETTAVTLEGKIFWSKVAYIGIVSAAPFFFLFALRYTSMMRKHSRWISAGVWIIPIIILILTFTNENHRLIWSGFEWVSGTTILIYHHGIGFFVNILYIYLLVSIATGVLVINAIRNRYVYRKQSITLLIGVPIPIIWNILYVLGLSPVKEMDLTPVAFALTGLIIAWGIFKTRLFDLSPMDSEFVIENLGDGVVILDSQNRIVEINPAAQDLFDVTPKASIGNDLFEIIPLLRHRYIQEEQNVPLTAELEIISGSRYLEFQCHKLFNKNRIYIGQAIIVRDITTRKMAEIGLRESEQRYQELIEQAALPVIIVDQRSLEILFYNRRVSSLLDINNRFTRGFKIEKYFLDKYDIQKIFKHLKQHGLLSDYEAQMITQVGREIWVVISANLTHYENRQCLFLSFNDITQRKEVENSEKQERIFAEALSGSISALSSTLNFEEVLDRILINLEKVIPNNHANIMLVGEDGVAKIVRARGYDAELLEKLVSQVHLNVSETPTLHRMATTGAPVIVMDTKTDPIWIQRISSSWIRSYLGAPIHVKGEVVGYINLDSDQANMYNRIHTERLELFARQAAIAVENARLFERVEQMAIVDDLTGLFNRHHLFELGEREFERYKRHENSLSLIYMDLDHFKDVNDRYGHATGDRVLQNVASILGSSLRKMDIAGRIGGEEFLLLLPETDMERALLVAERIRKNIAETKTQVNDVDISITASLGVITMSDQYSSLQALISAVDQSMYQAKVDGRNRVFDSP